MEYTQQLNLDIPVPLKVIAGAEEEQKEAARTIIDGMVYIRDSFGGYVPESYLRLRTKIRVPKDALPALSSIRLSPQEIFVVITLDGNNQIIKMHSVTVGLANQSQIHPRETFFPAVQDRAVSILVAHNHPSGNLEPSESDLAATRRLVDCAKVLGIPVLDHLIVSAGGFVSLRERFPVYFQ